LGILMVRHVQQGRPAEYAVLIGLQGLVDRELRKDLQLVSL
jgi:hypothetical protein